MSAGFIEELRLIEREKEIPFGVLLDALETALATAYKKSLGIENEVSLRIEQVVGGKSPMRFFRRMMVVDEVTNPYGEVTLSDARARLKPDAVLGEVVEESLGDKDMERMSRIAAQTAKQVVVQRIREAERDKIFDEYNDRVGEVITGTVSRREGESLLVSFGKLDARLPKSEQVPGEGYRFNDRVKVFVVEVRKGAKGPDIKVSRTHPSLIRRLFELEVPEIHDGVVTIKSVAREPGQRSKIAVTSKDDRVDPVGACVGHRGQRVQGVVDELRGEKIDIVRWSADNRQFIIESLSPAKVTSVSLNDENKAAAVVVPDNQLSLAIGKSGQNVRLAARLTGWRIDIRAESQSRDMADAASAAPGRPEPAVSTAPRATAPAAMPVPAAAAPVETSAQDDGSDLPPITFGDDDGADLPPITFGDDDEG